MEVPHPKMSISGGQSTFISSVKHFHMNGPTLATDVRKSVQGRGEVVHKQDELISKELTVAIAR